MKRKRTIGQMTLFTLFIATLLLILAIAPVPMPTPAEEITYWQEVEKHVDARELAYRCGVCHG